ncbi:MAG: hypothetical protein WD029_08205 [Microthrixaceae bacterium]
MTAVGGAVPLQIVQDFFANTPSSQNQTSQNQPSLKMPALLARRRLLLGGLGGVGLVAGAALSSSCSSGATDTTSEGINPGPKETLTALFPRDIAYLASGVPSRLVYTLTDAEGVPAFELPGPMTFSVERDGVALGSPIKVAPRSDGVPRPYLPLYFTFPAPGLYDIFATRGSTRLNSQVIVSPATEVQSPQVNSPLPPANTPTTTASYDVDPICTQVPQCPFHEFDLPTALGTGRPIVVLLATPAYCQTAACGPILDLLVEESAALPENVIVIHSEVYQNPKTVRELSDAELAPLPLAYKLGFEPSLFVTNSANVIQVRGDIAVDRGEMAEMLALAK